MEVERILDALEGAQRPIRTAINIALAVLIGLLLARLFWFVFAPAGAGASTVNAELPRPIADTKTSLIVDRTVLFKKNFFETTDQVVVVEQDAPETNLNLKLEGVVAPSRSGNEAGGAAYIRLSNNERKRFVPGDIVINGAELVRVEVDRVLLSRDGNTETLLLRNPDRAAGIVPFEERELEAARSSSESLAFSVTGTREQFFANVAARTVRNDGRELLQLSAKSSQSEFENLKFQNGDILLSACLLYTSPSPRDA